MSAWQSELESVAHHSGRGEVMGNSELLARFLYALKSADNTISTAIYIADQGQVIAMRTDGSIVRIPTSGEGLIFIREVIDGLVRAE